MRSDRDVERYSSPSRFEAEKRTVFRRLPLVVGRERELLGPGFFFTHDAAGVPLLITRDGEGSLRAMLNVCTHRGTRLVAEERGVAASFVCKLHAWRFGLDGQLARPGRTSLPQALEDFMDDRALVALPCEARHGFVWVVPTARAGIDVAASLGAPLDAELSALGLSDLVEVRREVGSTARNWKRVMETVLDHVEPGRVLSIFPSSALVIDAEHVSLLSFFPASVEETTIVHTLLAPRDHAAGDGAAALHERASLRARDVLLASEAEPDAKSEARRRELAVEVDRVIEAHPLRARP